MQHYLDPSNASHTTNNWIPNYPIPLKVRNFGFCPDFSHWLPGDLILVSATQPDFIQRAIRTVQKDGGYAHEDARWEHAAVHIGSGSLCEATRKGVVVSDIYPYVGNHLIRIRRNLVLSNDQRWELAVNALKLQNYGYGYYSIVQLLWKAKISGFWATANFSYPKRTRICSELYADAHTKASGGMVLGNIAAGEITPASLSMESKLTDIASDWVKIV